MFKEFILNNNSYFIRELRRSIKNIEIEERMDLLLHRPVGLLLSWGAIKVGLTPNLISLLSLLCGVTAGTLFYWQNNFQAALVGCLFLIFSGILDTVDGQVARLTNKSSRFGMYIDGQVDYLVFTAAYIGGVAYFLPHYGLCIVLLAIFSGFLHAAQTQVYEFYKNEYSYLGCGEIKYKNKQLTELKEVLQQADTPFEKFLVRNHINYVWRQNIFILRKGENRDRFVSLHNDPVLSDKFRIAYRKTYYSFLSSFGLFGGLNTHRTLIIIFILFAHFDYYLLASVALTVPVIFLSFMQAKSDRIFLESFSK